METNDVIFTEDIYTKHLGSINDVKFTPREIDVMACLLSARRTSQIASMLSIAPRTVTTHFRNIMLRLDCNSQEGIINFIERSHKLPLLREYYSRLVIELAFGKALKEISKLKREESSSCLSVYWQDQGLKNALIHHFQNHLSQAGINTKVQEQGLDQKIENVENPNYALLLLIEKKDNLDIAQEPADHKFIDLSGHHNYYLAVFEILRELLPNTDLKSILEKFREQYEEIHSSSGDKYPQTYREEKLDINENLIIYNALQPLKNRKKPFISALLVICLTVGTLIFKGNKKEEQNYSQARNATEEPSIRSDLVIPAETAFLHRSELISQIDDKFKGQDGIQTVALVGPGGAGKTTLARQYAHQQTANVIWEINAETNESLKESFESLAQAFVKTDEERKILRDIQDEKNAKRREEKVLPFVKEHLRTYSNWILLYDNVEKFSDIQKYLPQDRETWGQGKVILTTRDSNIENNKHVDNIIQIGALSLNQKVSLFIKIINHGITPSFTLAQTEEIKQFLEKLPPFPLDISVAAYYLKTTNVPYSLYLELLSGCNKDFINMQEDILKEGGDYAKTRYGIIILSLQRLLETNKDFGDLLLFISLLDSQNIPYDLLNSYKDRGIVDNFIYHLKKYSLITRNLSPNVFEAPSFSIHRSTQQISLNFLSTSQNLKKNKQMIQSGVTILEKYIIHVVSQENILKIKKILSHCEKFLMNKNLLTDDMKGSLGGELGFIYFYLGKSLLAQKILEESLLILTRNYSKKDDKLSFTLVALGNVYRGLGKYEKAKNLLEQNLVICKKNVSKNYHIFSWNLVSLGILYMNLGHYKKAKIFFEQSIIIHEKYLSKDNRYAWALLHLGHVYNVLGDYEKAKNILEQSLTIYKQYVGESHPKSLAAISILGNVYQKMGNYKKAQNLFEHCLNMLKKYYPKDYVGIARILINLGKLYKETGCYAQAMNFFNKSMAIYEKNCERNPFQMIKILRGIGQTHLLEGRLEIAEQFLHKAFKISQTIKFCESCCELESLAELYLKKSLLAKDKGNFQQSQTFKNQAANYLKQALEIVKTHFPAGSPRIIRIQSKLNHLLKEDSHP